MKQFKKLVIVIVLMVGAVNFANAQSKIAHINVEKLMADMPEMKTAEAELKKLSETYQSDIQSSYKELETKMNLYSNEAASKTEEENKQRAKEVDYMQRSIMEAQQQAQQELQKKRVDLLKPILQKANDAILKVGRSQGYQYVLDASTGSGVILADGKDILVEVKKELGF